MREGRRGVSPSTGLDALDFEEIFEMLREPQPESRAEADDRASKRKEPRGKSRFGVKILFLQFRKGFRMLSIRGVHFIQQRGQSRTDRCIIENMVPCSIPFEFRQERGQIANKLLPVMGRQDADGFFNLLEGSHRRNINCQMGK